MGNGYVVKWNGGKAYVGETGKVEGADGEIWPIGKAMWMLKRMLKHRNLDFTIEECEMCIVDEPKKRGRKKKTEQKILPCSMQDHEGFFPGQYKVDPNPLQEEPGTVLPGDDEPAEGECIK